MIPHPPIFFHQAFDILYLETIKITAFLIAYGTIRLIELKYFLQLPERGRLQQLLIQRRNDRHTHGG